MIFKDNYTILKEGLTTETVKTKRHRHTHFDGVENKREQKEPKEKKKR